MTDRVAGLVVLIFAILYGLDASRLKSGFGSGPVGPKEFPLLLAVVIGAMAIPIILRRDSEPSWPGGRTWVNFGLVLGSFVGYAYLLVPIGFIAATTLETGFVSQRFGARPWQALVVGLVSSVLLYALFVFALGIPLPIGRIVGGR